MNRKGYVCLLWLCILGLGPISATNVFGQEGAADRVLTLAAIEEGVITANGFSYHAHGRPDPFEPWTVADHQGPRPPGIRGMTVDELDLMGIVMTPDGKDRYAIVMGKDNKGYSMREGDELWDGKVKRIEKDRVLFLVKLNDPLSLEEYKEVPKLLSPDGR